MGFLIGSGVILLIAIVLLIASVALRKQAESFKQNMRVGKAVVAGYDRADESNWYTLVVKIPALNDNSLYNCTGGNIDTSKYPIGTEVDVLYAPKKIMGINMVEVHLVENPPADSAKLSRGFKNIALALFAIAGIILVLGLLFFII